MSDTERWVWMVSSWSRHQSSSSSVSSDIRRKVSSEKSNDDLQRHSWLLPIFLYLQQQCYESWKSFEGCFGLRVNKVLIMSQPILLLKLEGVILGWWNKIISAQNPTWLLYTLIGWRVMESGTWLADCRRVRVPPRSKCQENLRTNGRCKEQMIDYKIRRKPGVIFGWFSL